MSTSSDIKRSLKSAKSRGGCQRCRAKRIKCDETKPACKICLANGVECPGFARQLRWSSKHEVFPKLRQETKRQIRRHEVRSTTQSSTENDINDLAMRNTQDDQEDRNATQGKNSSTHNMQWDNVDMSEMLDWPNFEFCGFNDLGLSTPVMGQETSAELDALCNASVSSIPTETSSHTMSMMDVGMAAPYNAFVEQPVMKQKSTLNQEKSIPQSKAEGPAACTDSVRLLQTYYRLSMPSAVPGFSDMDFVHHYFNNTCTIYSCFDSDMNPFRTYVAEHWSECRTTYLAIQAMSASHLANFYPHMAPMGLAKRSQAWLSLQRDLRHAREGKQESDRVLLCLLLLGLSSTWHQSANLGLEYLFAARDIVQRKLRSPQGVKSERDEFFLSALMHWEMLASFVDPVPLMPLSGLKSPEPKLPLTDGPRLPHPWTGVVKELHFVLAEIGRVLRRQRYLASATGLSEQRREALRGQDEEWMVKLERMLLDIPNLGPDDIAEYNDPKTPKADMIRVTEAYRYVGLLEIYNAFPSVLEDQINQDCVPDDLATLLGIYGDTSDRESQLANMANHIMETIKPISIVSGACRLLPLVLLACASNVRFLDEPSTPDGTESVKRDELVEKRYFLEARMMTLSRKFPQKPLLQMMEIIKEVWVRLDAGHHGAHWMDVAHENGWQTIFG